MADSKITALDAIDGGSIASSDELPLVDVSDPTMAASGTNKKTTIAGLATAVTATGLIATDAEVTAAVAAHVAAADPHTQYAQESALAMIATTGSAANLTTGTVPTARLGSGTASSATFLRGDQTYATPPGVSLTDRGAWVTATAYSAGDIVTQYGGRHVAASAHTAATSWITDNTAGKWIPLDAPEMRNASRVGGMLAIRSQIAKARAGTADMKMICIGDSITQGIVDETSTHSWTDAWPYRLRQYLEEHPRVTVAEGFQNVWTDDSDSWTVPSGWVTCGIGASGQYSTGIRANSSPAGAVTGTFTCAGFNIWKYANTGFGSGTVTIDGGAPTTIDCAVGSGLVKVPFALSAGSHSISIAWAAGTFMLPYIEIIPSATGTISIYNAGIGGATCNTFLVGDSSPPGANSYLPSSLAGGQGFTAAMVSLGINECTTGIAPATYQTNLTTIITTLVGLSISPIIVIEPPIGLPTSYTYPWSSYVAAQYAVADAQGVPLFDPASRWVDRVTMQTFALSTTNTHLTKPGYADMATWIETLLMS